MNIPKIEGVFCAMMTPFGTDGAISQKSVEDFMRFYIEKGLDGVFAVSNVGEFACLSLEKKKLLIEICCSTGKGKIKLCPGVTDFNLDNCFALAEHAKQSGADAVVLSAPVYYPHHKSYVEEFIRIFLRDSPMPVIFYHSPKFSNPVSFDFLIEIMSSKNIAAIKESSGDAIFALKLLNKCNEIGIQTPVMLGWEELQLTGLTYGAKGSITSCGGIVPEIMRGIFDQFKAGKYEKAAKLQKSISRITTKLSAYGFPQGYKMGMAARGLNTQILQSPKMSELEKKLKTEIPTIALLLDNELNFCKQIMA